MAIKLEKRNRRWCERRRHFLYRQLRKTGLFVDGSFAKLATTCGNTMHCKCSRGQKHISYYLMFKVGGKSTGIYIPVALKEKVIKWRKENRKLKNIIKEICDIQKHLIRTYV